MSRFAKLFERLASKNEGAFVPFVNLCDPTPERSLEILRTLAKAGADAFELGIPFSDPCADGPVIAASSTRALANGSTTAKCFEVIRTLRAEFPEIPVSLMLYVNLVYAPGPDKFFADAAAAGVDAVLIPDVPMSMREADTEWDEAAGRHGIELVAIATPNADAAQLKIIAEHTEGYTYLLSRAGVTGTDRAAGTPVHEKIAALADAGAPPSLLGFGVSRPEHVKAALAAGAAGVIVGSAIVRIINTHIEDQSAMNAELTDYVKTMKAATL